MYINGDRMLEILDNMKVFVFIFLVFLFVVFCVEGRLLIVINEIIKLLVFIVIYRNWKLGCEWKFILYEIKIIFCY